MRLEVHGGRELEEGYRRIAGRHRPLSVLAVEPNNRVAITFYGSTGTALYYATCAADCFTPSSWSKSLLDGSISSVGEHPSLAVRAGVVEVAMDDRTNGNLASQADAVSLKYLDSRALLINSDRTFVNAIAR